MISNPVIINFSPNLTGKAGGVKGLDVIDPGDSIGAVMKGVFAIPSRWGNHSMAGDNYSAFAGRRGHVRIFFSLPVLS